MLSKEHEILIDNIVFFRDLQDEKKYYYLPTEDVIVSGNGTKLQFVAFQDSEIKTKDEPDFSDPLKSGAYLALQVELGPSESALEKAASKLGSGIKIVPVPFKSGTVQLMMFGASESSPSLIIAGASKPSLIGKHNAAFTLKLGSEEAQIMWNLLKGKNQTQVTVMYNMTFMGISPAHDVKITVDFSAVDDYWHHKFTTGFDLNYSKNVKDTSIQQAAGIGDDNTSIIIAADVDIDTMIHDLVNDGKIIVQNLDYTGTGEGSPIGADDPSAMKLVKELLSSTLFTPTPMPSEGSSAVEPGNDTASHENKSGDRTDKQGTDESNSSSSGKKGAGSRTPDPVQTEESKKKDQEAIDNASAAPSSTKTSTSSKTFKRVDDSDGEILEFDDVAGDDKIITKEEWIEAELAESDFDSYAIDQDGKKVITSEQYRKYLMALKKALKSQTQASAQDEKAFKDIAGDDKLISQEEWENAKLDKGLFEKYSTEKDGKKYVTEEQYNKFRNDSKQQTPAEAAAEEAKRDGDNNAPQNSKVTTLGLTVSATIGYTYKKIKQSERVTRTYIFNKQQAQQYEFTTSGALSLKGTDFNPENQMDFVRFGQDAFKTVTVDVHSGLDFKKNHIKEVIVDFYYEGLDIWNAKEGEQGRTFRSEKSITLNAEHESDSFKFDGGGFGIDGHGYNYKVKIVFDGSAEFVGCGDSMPGSFETEWKEASDTSIIIDRGFLTEVYPVRTAIGDIKFSADSINAASIVLRRIETSEDGVSSIGPVVEEIQFKDGDDSVMLYLNKKERYQRTFTYSFNDSKYKGVPCTKNSLSVIAEDTESDEIYIHSPGKGKLLVHTLFEEDTFLDVVQGVRVALRRSGQTVNITLSKQRPACYYLYDYTPEDKTPIIVESVIIFKKDADGRAVREDFTPIDTVLSVDDVDLTLDIY